MYDVMQTTIKTTKSSFKKTKGVIESHENIVNDYFEICYEVGICCFTFRKE